MTKTLLIACTLMMAGSVYAQDPGAGEVVIVGVGATLCKGSEEAGKTHCSEGGVEDSVEDSSTPASAN